MTLMLTAYKPEEQFLVVEALLCNVLVSLLSKKGIKGLKSLICFLVIS